jgi:hypothetical protein
MRAVPRIVLCIAATATLAGCAAGELCGDPPDPACVCRYTGCLGDSGAGGGGDEAMPPGACTMFTSTAEFQEKFLTAHCGGTSDKNDDGCHNAVSAFFPKFDVPDEIVKNVVDQPPVMNKRCTDDKIVDSAEPEKSFLLRKIEPANAKVSCVHTPEKSGGARMPFGATVAPLSAAEIACVTWWVNEIVK